MTKDEKKLSDLMNAISERCYSAAWMANLEYVLWNVALSGPAKYGHDVISQDDINQLIQLSEKTQAWIIFDDNHEETSISLDKWKEKFKEEVLRDPSILKG